MRIAIIPLALAVLILPAACDTDDDVGCADGFRCAEATTGPATGTDGEGVGTTTGGEMTDGAAVSGVERVCEIMQECYGLNDTPEACVEALNEFGSAQELDECAQCLDAMTCEQLGDPGSSCNPACTIGCGVTVADVLYADCSRAELCECAADGG